uniref:Uncharacterized protein n=1 Tax=Pararge aegeria TaxID=116150 RepID=S4P2V2_9NEOP
MSIAYSRHKALSSPKLALINITLKVIFTIKQKGAVCIGIPFYIKSVSNSQTNIVIIYLLPKIVFVLGRTYA